MDDKFPRTGDEGVVLGRFGCITFIEHFISNLMLPLILQEEPVHSPEVRTPVLGDASFQGGINSKALLEGQRIRTDLREGYDFCPHPLLGLFGEKQAWQDVRGSGYSGYEIQIFMNKNSEWGR